MIGQIKPGKAPGSWYLRVELERDMTGKRKRVNETVRGTKAEAQRRLREMLRAAETGLLSADRVTMGDVFDQWIISREAKGRANKTLSAYRQQIEDWLKPTFGTIEARALRSTHIEQGLASWRVSARKGRGAGVISARTVRHLYDTLRAALVWAERAQIMPSNPITRVEPPAFESPEIITIDAQGVMRLLEEARKCAHPLVAPIITSLGSGLRRGELLGLRWTDIDLETGVLMVRRSIEVVSGERREKPPKTKRSARANVLPAFVVDALKKHRQEQRQRRLAYGLGRDDASYVFDTLSGEAWHPDTFSYWVNASCDRAGLPAVTLQALRRSFGTFLLEAGVDMRTVSKALGHTNTVTTERSYLGTVPTLDRDLAARLQVVLGDLMGDGGSGQLRAN